MSLHFYFLPILFVMFLFHRNEDEKGVAILTLCIYKCVMVLLCFGFSNNTIILSAITGSLSGAMYYCIRSCCLNNLTLIRLSKLYFFLFAYFSISMLVKQFYHPHSMQILDTTVTIASNAVAVILIYYKEINTKLRPIVFLVH